MHTKLQEASRRAKVTVLLSMIDVFDSALDRVSAPISRDVSCIDPLRRDAEMFDVQMKYDRAVA